MIDQNKFKRFPKDPVIIRYEVSQLGLLFCDYKILKSQAEGLKLTLNRIFGISKETLEDLKKVGG